MQMAKDGVVKLPQLHCDTLPPGVITLFSHLKVNTGLFTEILENTETYKIQIMINS